MLINTGKNTPIIDSNDKKRINSQEKIDEIVLHPMHGAPPPKKKNDYVCVAGVPPNLGNPK